MTRYSEIVTESKIESSEAFDSVIENVVKLNVAVVIEHHRNGH